MNNMNENELESMYWSLSEWIDEINQKTHRSFCRIGTTIEKKNDQKRVNESRVILEELDELCMEIFEECGLYDETIKLLECKADK